MSEREERRFVEIPRESVRLMAESTGLELSDEVAALLAEDVCYRLREATQVRFPFAPGTLPTLLVPPGGYPLPQGCIKQVCGPPLLCALRERSGGSPCPLQFPFEPAGLLGKQSAG